MEEGFEMEDGNDGGKGSAYGGGEEGLMKEEVFLDQDMEGCREDCLLSRKTLSGAEGVLDVNEGNERGGRTLEVDLGGSSGGACADKNGVLHVLDGKGREGVNVALDWRKAVVGDFGVKPTVHGDGVEGNNQEAGRNGDSMDTESGGAVFENNVVGGNEEVGKKSGQEVTCGP